MPNCRSRRAGLWRILRGERDERAASQPRDFTDWVKLGNDEWSWEAVLPYFIRAEDDPPEVTGTASEAQFRFDGFQVTSCGR